MKVLSDEGGISIVISVLMLMAIFIGAYAAYMVVALPQEFAGKEMDHMLEVRDSFADFQNAVQGMYENESRSIEVPMSANLSSGIFRGPSIAGSLSVGSGVIIFDIQNGYYYPQSYIYDNGGVIMFQSRDNQSSIVSDPPFIAVSSMEGDNILVTIQTVNLVGSSSIASTGTATITATLNGISTSSTENTDNLIITVYSTYRSAWGEYLKKLAKELRDENIDAVADVESLQLTIPGKGPPGEIDVYYTETRRDVSITIW